MDLSDQIKSIMDDTPPAKPEPKTIVHKGKTFILMPFYRRGIHDGYYTEDYYEEYTRTIFKKDLTINYHYNPYSWGEYIMKVKDLSQEQIKPGLRIKSLTRELYGTISSIDHVRDDYAWIHWDDKPHPHSGFHGTDCECEIVIDTNGQPLYISIN